MIKLKIIVAIFLIVLLGTAFTALDIAPNPIEAKGIIPTQNCKIRMESEIVQSNIYKDSSDVVCSFELVNYGKETTIEVGFPVMDFQYWSFGGYYPDDKSNFVITVDGKILSKNDIKVPAEMQEVYNEFMKEDSLDKVLTERTSQVYSFYNVIEEKYGIVKYPKNADVKRIEDSISALYKWRNSFENSFDKYSKFDELVRDGKFPWYVWNISFEENEHKTVKVSYKLPSGLAYRAKYRYFKYILNTGAGWYKDIGEADIILNLHDVDISKIEKISPQGYKLNKKKKVISWDLKNIEPTVEDDIYVQFYTSQDGRNIKKMNRILKRMRRKTAREREQN